MKVESDRHKVTSNTLVLWYAEMQGGKGRYLVLVKDTQLKKGTHYFRIAMKKLQINKQLVAVRYKWRMIIIQEQ